MPSIDQNKQSWNGRDWAEAGNEWSAPFGTSAMQWYASILPRIHAHLPVSTILEIAPGFGRWTQYLKDMCDRLLVVDLSEKCITGCKERFKACANIQYHLNDGRSLAMIPDHTVDFLFSFDSLVHVEKDVIGEYLGQLTAKLAPNGVGFIHHTNIGAFAAHYAFADSLPRGRRLLSRLQLVEPGDHMRARSMTADIFLKLATDAGLKVISQELINWQSRRTIDCFSTFTLPGSTSDSPYQRLVNPDFDKEAAYIKKLSEIYESRPTVETSTTRTAGRI